MWIAEKSSFNKSRSKASVLEIKTKFFGDKAGLIYFKDKQVNIATNLDKFATVSISQDNYRFALAKTDTKYNFIKLQTK